MNFPNLFPKTVKPSGAFRVPSPKKKQEASVLYPTPKNPHFGIPAASILYFNYFNQFMLPQNNHQANSHIGYTHNQKYIAPLSEITLLSNLSTNSST